MADDEETCGWYWPPYLIALTSISGVLFIAALVLTIVNTRMYHRMKVPHQNSVRRR